MNEANLFEALEICLQKLEDGASEESCLALFPSLAEDLRPVLRAALQARSSAVTVVPEAVAQRGKARVLQAAAEMRERRGIVAVPLPLPARKKGFFATRFFRFAIASVSMLVFLLTGGTGLVNASSTSIPGDRLYSVKRSWEDVRLFFVFDHATRTQLETEFDNERVKEIQELYTENRTVLVNFHGVAGTGPAGGLVVGGLNITVGPETVLTEDIVPGSLVEVSGETEDGLVKAKTIKVIATPSNTPIPGLSPNPTLPSSPDELHTPEPSETSGSVQMQPSRAVETPESTQPPESTSTEFQRTPEPTSISTEQGGGGSGSSSTEVKTPEFKPTETDH